jgi:hypothetical protein
MFGVGGILLAIPFAAIMDYIYKEFILVVLTKRKLRREEKYREDRARERERKKEEREELLREEEELPAKEQ